MTMPIQTSLENIKSALKLEEIDTVRIYINNWQYTDGCCCITIDFESEDTVGFRRTTQQLQSLEFFYDDIKSEVFDPKSAILSPRMDYIKSSMNFNLRGKV